MAGSRDSWCECGRYRGKRICCDRCRYLDGEREIAEITYQLRMMERASVKELAEATDRHWEAVYRSLRALQKKGRAKRVTTEITEYYEGERDRGRFVGGYPSEPLVHYSLTSRMQ